MLIPSTYTLVLLVLGVSAIAWGAWANLQKAAGKYRYEYFAILFSFGALLAAAVAALTFGSMGSDLTFEDNLVIAGKRNIAVALGAGALASIANFLTIASVAVGGMSVAVPLSLGLAVVLNALYLYLNGANTNATFLLAGAGLALAGVAAAAMAHFGAQKGNRSNGGAKGVAMAAIAGLLYGAFVPVLQASMTSDIGLGAYTAVFFAAAGVLLVSPVLSLFFLNLPIHGEPAAFKGLFRAPKGGHLAGLGAGMLWACGLAALLAGVTGGRAVRIGTQLPFALLLGGSVLGTAAGFLVWKEAKLSGPAVGALVLLAAGAAVMALA